MAEVSAELWVRGRKVRTMTAEEGLALMNRAQPHCLADEGKAFCFMVTSEKPTCRRCEAQASELRFLLQD